MSLVLILLSLTDPPTINKTKLSSAVPVFSGYAEDLKCEADGNPRPEIRWISEVDLPPQRSDGVLSVTQEGKYTCNATNHYGSDYHHVEVIEKSMQIIIEHTFIFFNSGLQKQ